MKTKTEAQAKMQTMGRLYLVLWVGIGIIIAFIFTLIFKNDFHEHFFLFMFLLAIYSLIKAIFEIRDKVHKKKAKHG